MIRQWAILLGGVVVATAAIGGSAVLAADMPVKAPAKVTDSPPASWTGCYVGGQIGGASSDARWRYGNLNPYDSSDPAGPMVIPEERFQQLRTVVGGQAGCNLNTSGPWVFGAELSWLATPMDLTFNDGRVQPVTGFTPNIRTDVKSIVSIAGRIGYSLGPDWLVYAKAGYAAAYIGLSGNLTPAGNDGLAWSDTNWYGGWTAGAGVEYRLFRNVTIGAEYNYYRFGSNSFFGAQLGVPDANQIRGRADLDVHTVMARLSFYDPTAPMAQAASANPGPTGSFSSFFTSSVDYSSWTGSRGPNVFAPNSGHASQVYSPFSTGIDYVEPDSFKFEARVKGGYVYTRQATPGQTAVYSGPIDTQTSFNVVLLGFDSVRPQFGVAMNLPTGTSYLPNDQRFTRGDPDLVEVGAYGAGFNINPTAGLVVGLNKDTAVSFSAGYAWNGKFMREQADLNAGGGYGAFDIKQYISPGDALTINANLTTQINTLTLLSSFAYMSSSRAQIDGVDSGKAGARYTSNVTATWQIDERAAIATNASWSFSEKNEIANGTGGLVDEPKNSNSHVVIGSIEPSYRVTDALRLAVSYSFLWRSANFYDQFEDQFIPAKEKQTAGLSAQYAVSPNTSLEIKGSHSWIHQNDSAILPVTLTPPTSAPEPPALHYQAWAVSTTANVHF